MYKLPTLARKRCPPKIKDCAVAALYDKISRNDILVGGKEYPGKFGAVIVMVTALYDKIGGDDVLADAHAECCKKFPEKHGAVTCSPECSKAWSVIYRLGYDETNRDEINEERRENWPLKRRDKRGAQKKTVKTCPDCGAKFSKPGEKPNLIFQSLPRVSKRAAPHRST